MESNTAFYSIIKKSQKILLIVPPQPSIDQLTAAFATSHFLAKFDKNPVLLLDQNLPAQINFLKKPAEIIDNLSGSRDFLLLFNTKHNKIINLASEKKENQFIVRITPEKGAIDPRDFSFVPANFNYDLIITFGAFALESLGKIYQKNTDLFFEVPKINIDNHAENDNFGQVNLIDMTAASICEICTELFSKKKEILDKPIVQALLTGIIAETESFQKSTTTPRTMLTAARLMKLKADQPEIIRYLYKTKSLSFLKLWGRVMAHLTFDETLKFAWSTISTEDFIQSKSDEQDIPFILEEVQKNFSHGQIFGIFYNNLAGKPKGLFSFSNPQITKEIANLNEAATTDGRLKINFKAKDIVAAEKSFINQLKEL